MNKLEENFDGIVHFQLIEPKIIKETNLYVCLWETF